MTENIETHEKLPRSIELARELENSYNRIEIKDKLAELLENIEKDTGTRFSHEVSVFYKSMQSEQCLARIERLSRVLEATTLNKPLPISEETESHYANAVVPETEGLKIAFSEGQAPGPIRTVVGFGKTLIGFKTDHLSVTGVKFDDRELRDVATRKRLCRHVVGNLEKNDIRYLVMRIPFNLLPEKHLTQNELAKKPSFIFRGLEFRNT